jgi:hypothetical protein
MNLSILNPFQMALLELRKLPLFRLLLLMLEVFLLIHLLLKTKLLPNLLEIWRTLFRKNKDPIENLPVVETCEELPEGQDPSPSVAAFNENFNTSHRGELLSVSHEMTIPGGGAYKLLLLRNSSNFMDETEEEAPKQAPRLLNKTIRDLEKQPSSSSKKTSATTERAAHVVVETLNRNGL